MPRHRKERARTSRALRREDGSRRSVILGVPALPVRPAFQALLAAGHGARRALGRAGGPGRGRTAARGECLRRLRLARSLMVTPWLAASAGIVIAAALAVDAPTALTYVPNSPAMRCTASGCASPTASPPDVATARPGERLKTSPVPRAATPPGAGRRHAVYQLRYHVARRRARGFVAVIIMPSDMKPGTWILRLAFPSARVDQVWGARWEPSRHGHAGTATGSWPLRGHGPGGDGPDGRMLMIFATGAPTLPSGCRLDGARCGFRR